MTALTCWTAADLETQPWIRRTPAGPFEATFVVGVWTELPFAVELSATAEVAQLGAWSPVAAGSVRQTELTQAELAHRDTLANDANQAHDWLEATRGLADVRNHLARQADDPLRYPKQRYFEVVVKGLPAGGLVRFQATAKIARTELRARSDWAGLWLVDPDLGVADVVSTRLIEGSEDQWWVLMHAVRDGFEHVRLDLLQTSNRVRRRAPARNIVPVSVALDAQTFDASAGHPIGPGPVDPTFVGVRVDRSTDSILLTRRSTGLPLANVTVTTRTDSAVPDPIVVPINPAAKTARPVGLMLIAYAIQGLNDLFVEPIAGYQPPRNFAQVAYSDEQALFSGRPETTENAVADGYRYVLTSQRHYGVDAVWAFNAGALLLLKHSLPKALFTELTQAVADGVISVANAGTGAHRNYCYQSETNVEEIARADQLIRDVLAHAGVPATTNGIYFPDSRIYAAKPAELTSYAALQSAELVDAIVLDRSTVAHRVGSEEKLYFGDEPAPNEPNTKEHGNYLWTDSTTGLKLLLIEDRVRDKLVAGSDDEVPRGQLDYELRRMFLRALHEDRVSDRSLPPKLYCFGDDIDHLAGNGWFDGNYRDRKSYANAFLSALCWLRAHPWVRACTPDDPGFSATFGRADPLTVSSAIDATMDPGGAATRRFPGDPALHFDSWVKAWRETVSPWLGTTLGVMSDTLESALIGWDPALRNKLYDIAWTYYLSCTHESMWSKEPLERRDPPRPLDNPFKWEPEDFVISESLQQRNAWVYLNASIWARWAAQGGQPGNFVLDHATVGDARSGPLLAALRSAHSADAWWTGADPGGHGLYWDRDNLANVVLYNRQALCVIDRNGGRITQLFTMVGGQPVSVSGTNKAYQFLEVGPPQVACDGQRVQNTVFTPNHAYVATDVTQAAPRAGSYRDQRNDAGPNPTWLPDNLNAYDCTGSLAGPAAQAVCRYLTTPVAELPADDLLSWETVAAACEQDLIRLRAGQPGVVWHEGAAFTKTIGLDGNRIRVQYAQTQPGHLVANEFSVDLLHLLEGGERQTRLVQGNTATITSAAGLSVRIVLGAGCAFTAETRLAAGPGSRVMTEDIRIVAQTAAGFDYSIELPI
ncbi:MAG TPA: hypothetical protein VIT20_07685 [Propionibacteriaceae bacterium]